MSDLSFIPLGVGDAFSSRYYSACLLVESQGFRLLVDCPHPIRKMLREATGELSQPVDIPDIDAVLISHLHADHCSGLEGLIYYNHYRLKRQTALFMHPVVTEHLWDGCLGSGERGDHQDAMESFVDVSPLSFDESVQVGPFQVHCRSTVHSRPTTAFRIATTTRSLGVSADTSFDPELIDWLAQADRFIHETNLPPHTPYESLAALPDDVTQRMWLTHYPDEFKQEHARIELLRQGARYIV